MADSDSAAPKSIETDVNLPTKKHSILPHFKALFSDETDMKNNGRFGFRILKNISKNIEIDI